MQPTYPNTMKDLKTYVKRKLSYMPSFHFLDDGYLIGRSPVWQILRFDTKEIPW